jgi:hypothetical protein
MDVPVVFRSMARASGVTIIANASGLHLPVESQLEKPHYIARDGCKRGQRVFSDTVSIFLRYDEIICTELTTS